MFPFYLACVKVWRERAREMDLCPGLRSRLHVALVPMVWPLLLVALGSLSVLPAPSTPPREMTAGLFWWPSLQMCLVAKRPGQTSSWVRCLQIPPQLSRVPEAVTRPREGKAFQEPRKQALWAGSLSSNYPLPGMLPASPTNHDFGRNRPQVPPLSK